MKYDVKFELRYGAALEDSIEVEAKSEAGAIEKVREWIEENMNEYLEFETELGYIYADEPMIEMIEIAK